MAKPLFDAVYGSIIGGAIGDALGAPVEGWYYDEIKERFGRITDFVSARTDNAPDGPGGVTDDTTLAHYISLAIIRKGGRITPDDLAAIWLEKGDNRRFWTNERIVWHKLREGMNPWDSGKGTIPAGCATMAIGPIGIINAGNPAQAYQDGFNIAFVNQDDANRDAAATLAAGVAAALDPELVAMDAAQAPTAVERVLAAMRAHSSFLVRRAIELTEDLAPEGTTVAEFAARFYEHMLDWTWPRRNWKKEHFFSGSSLEIVPVVMVLLRLCQGDVNECLIEGASFGRDCDTISRALGCIAGALQGASAIRPEWIEQVERANEPLFQELEGDPEANFYSLAQRVIVALESEGQRAEARAQSLAMLLAPSRRSPTGASLPNQTLLGDLREGEGDER
jgi:ADP-ribosylglycohydrolase